MKGKITLLAGAGIGYVLGARAGRERYESLKESATRTADKVRHDPRVQEKAAQASEVAKDKAGTAAEAAKDKLGASGPGSSTTGPSAGKGSAGTGSTGTGTGA
jgi:hypothetical protein